MVPRNNIFNSSYYIIVCLFLYFDESEGREEEGRSELFFGLCYSYAYWGFVVFLFVCWVRIYEVRVRVMKGEMKFMLNI